MALNKDVPSASVAAEVLYEVDETGVATITLNRPESLNSFTPTMVDEYLRLLRQSDADADVRVVIVTGAGRGFCAGADRSSLQTLDTAALRESGIRNPRDIAVRIGKPVIAAVNGAVAGVGLAQALLADVRFTVPDAKWTTSFAKLGLVAEVNTSWSLVQLAGTGRALDLLLSSRIFSGRDAVEYGIAQFLSDPNSLLEDARAYARLIAQNHPESLKSMREQVRLDAARSFENAWDDTYQRVFEALERGDFRAAARAEASAK